MTRDQTESQNIYRILVRRALLATDSGNLPLYFEATVVQRYRDAAGFSLLRTNSVGRVHKEGGWSIDCGIAPGEEILHVSFGAFAGLPEAEREHWASFAIALPSSKMFLQMRLAPSACYDDGQVRAW